MPKEIDPSIWEKTGPCQGAQHQERCTNIAKLYEISEQNGETFEIYMCHCCRDEYEAWLEKDNRVSAHACGAW